MYRERRRACPGCGHPMDPLPVGPDSDGSPADVASGEKVEIDRCASCGGTLLDFFDGEPIRLASQIVGTHPPHVDRAPDAVITCPDCREPMTARPYLGEGPELPRCDGCMAVFVTSAQLAELAATQLSPDEENEPTWLRRLLDWLPGI